MVGVATRDVFSEQELARLRGFPEITRAELIRYFTLTSGDEGFLGKFLGQRNVLGAGVQLCTLLWLGFVPDDVSSAPPEVVTRLADRLGVAGAELRGYGERAQTRTDHLREVLRYAGWRVVAAPEWKQLDEFLFARAMEHDSPKVLFGSACEYLISERVVRPGVVLLLEHVAAARERARRGDHIGAVHRAPRSVPRRRARTPPRNPTNHRSRSTNRSRRGRAWTAWTRTRLRRDHAVGAAQGDRGGGGDPVPAHVADHVLAGAVENPRAEPDGGGAE